jgi:5'-methylthioadenosine phosphorylase
MRIGIIGGGHFWRHWELEFSSLNIETPYGRMSNSVYAGNVCKHEVFTLQRHGKNHELSPHNIPWCANVYGMHSLNLDFLIHVTACGGLTHDYKPGDIVLFDQIIDFTKARPTTLGYPVVEQVTHLSSAEPISIELLNIAHKIFLDCGIEHKQYAVMVTEEGPRFGTNAEINMFRLLGGQLINHTSATEVFLAQEVGLPVLSLGLVTNIVQARETYDDSKTYATIPDSINKFKTFIPNAIFCFLQNLGAPKLNKPKVRPIDISLLDIKKAHG